MRAYSESNAFRNTSPTFDCAISCAHKWRCHTAEVLDGSNRCFARPECRNAGRAVLRQAERVTQTVAAARVVATNRNAMKQGNTQSRQPLFWANKQYLRLRARPLEVGRGCRRKQLPFFPGTTIFGTTAARWADLLRWADPQDMSRQVGLVDGASSGSFRGTYLVVLYSSTQDAVRQEQTNHFSLDKNYRNSSSSSGASQSWLDRHELLSSVSAAAVCEHRLSPVFCILEKNLGTGCDTRSSGPGRVLSTSVSSAGIHHSRQLVEWNLAPAQRLAGPAMSGVPREQVAAAFSSGGAARSSGERLSARRALPAQLQFFRAV